MSAPVRNERLVTELVRTLAPEEPALEAATRDAVLADVTGFVRFEIDALPAFLGLPYRSALLAFDWLALLRYGRRFVALEPTRRCAWVSAWSGAGFGPARDFVKLLRSCVMLGYFDHPEVRSALAAAPRAVSP
jgi:hypothetical protein